MQRKQDAKCGSVKRFRNAFGIGMRVTEAACQEAAQNKQCRAARVPEQMVRMDSCASVWIVRIGGTRYSL